MAAFIFFHLGRLRRGQKGPVKGAAPPDEAPSALPSFTPQGFPTTADWRGLRGLCFGSFLAALGDLPARRAMPEYAFALKGGSAKKPRCASRASALNG